MFGDIPVCPKSVSSRFNPLNLFDFSSRKIALAGTRTSKGTSHPMTCGGCYHAQVMAGGESQLSVVIAGRVPLDFSEDGKRKLSAGARCIDRSWRTLRSGYSGKFVICGTIWFSRNLHTERDQTVTGTMRRRNNLIALHYIGLEKAHLSGRF